MSTQDRDLNSARLIKAPREPGLRLSSATCVEKTCRYRNTRTGLELPGVSDFERTTLQSSRSLNYLQAWCE